MRFHLFVVWNIHRVVFLSIFVFWKGWFWLCVRGELETGTDSHILTQSSPDHSSTSSSFCWAAQPWVLRAQALCLQLVLTLASYLQVELLLELELQLQLELNWLKPSVAPGYIIVWRSPASCGRTHLHRILPRPQIKEISSTRCTCFFRLFTQVHLLIDGSVEGQYVTKWLTRKK